MCRFANSDVLDEMTHLIRVYTVCYMYDKKESLEKEMQFYLEIISCDLSIPKVMHLIRKKNPLSSYMVKTRSDVIVWPILIQENHFASVKITVLRLTNPDVNLIRMHQFNYVMVIVEIWSLKHVEWLIKCMYTIEFICFVRKSH